jgi:DNA-directed RNA polymerase subunit delta
MKRIIVDYSKLTNEILNLLVEKFPDGYDDSHIIRFRNAQNELIEAVEVRTEDTIYLVKVSTKLASRLEKYEDDIDDIVEPIDVMKVDLEDEDATDDDEEENDLTKDSDDSTDSEDDDDDDDDDISADDEDDEDDE